MSKKILLADDSITIQKVVELTFSEGDYEVICVGNGAQAIRKAAEIVPDIALVDVMMPQRNGYEVCAQIKQDPATSWVPVLLLTGTFEPFDPRRADQVGADGHITKPFESRALVAQVEELLSRRPRPRGPEPEPVPLPIAASAGPEPAEIVNAGQIFQAAPAAEEPPAPPPPTAAGDASPATVRLDSRSFFAQLAAMGEVLDAPAAPAEAPSLGPVDLTAEEAELEPTHPLRAQKGRPAAPPAAEPEAPPRAAAPQPPPQERAAPPAPAPAAPPPAPQAPAVAAEDLRAALDRAVAEMAGPLVRDAVERIVREVAWEILPEVAESAVRRRIRELEEEASPEAARPH